MTRANSIKSLKEAARIWKEEAKPRFDRLNAILSDPQQTIPSELLASYYFDGSKSRRRNPILKFLRDYSAIEIIDLLSNASEDDRKKYLTSVFRPYFAAWEDLFNNFDRFYGDTATAARARNEFSTLAGDCGNFESLGPDAQYIIKHNPRYQQTFEAFCNDLAALPTETDPSNTKLRKAISKVIKKAKAKVVLKNKAWRTQAEVAKDFGVSKQTVITWEKKEPFAHGKRTNKWDYVKILRTDPDNEGAYKILLRIVAQYKILKMKNPQHPFSFVSYREKYLTKHYGTKDLLKIR